MAKLVLGLFVSIFSCLFTLSAVCLHFCWNGFYIKLGIFRQNIGFAIVCSAAFSHQPPSYLRTVFENDSKSLIFIIFTNELSWQKSMPFLPILVRKLIEKSDMA